MLIIFGFVPFVGAISLKGEYPACSSKSAFERLSAMAEHNDTEAIAKMLKTECYMPEKGLKVDKIVSRESGGIVQIKIYHKGELYDLWTSKYDLSAK